MAASLPNPRDFKSWEDAFQYPLPAVRKLEQQLRSHAAENREKLRSLVGGSYRDLLGTAERICDMDETMQAIETNLGQTASKCNSGVVDKIFANAAKLDTERNSRDAQRNGLAAQLSLLRNCNSCMTQLLKHQDQLYRATKVLVLGRLIPKLLTQQADVPPLLDGLRRQLASSESRLLKQLNRRLSDHTIDVQQLVLSMCAYSLAKSATPTEVLYHFLKVRLEAVRSLSTESRRARTNMLRAIQLFKTSLSAIQAIFPKRLAEGLAKVKLQPLLRDSDVQSLAELNLEIYERWIADDIRNYTPWPRHDELQKSDAQKITRSWVPAAMSALETAIEDILQQQTDLKDVLDLRTAVLEAHISTTDQAPGVLLLELLNSIRKVFNKRLSELVKQKAGGILALVEQIKATASALTAKPDSRTMSLWSLADEGASLDNGSSMFKDSIRDRLHGCTGSVRRCAELSEEWAIAIADARSEIQNMKERRWEDDMLDAGVDEDDLDLESLQSSLGEDDPRALDETLTEALRASLAQFGAALSELIKQGGDVEKALFLVRVVRDLAQRATTLDVHFDHAGLSEGLFTVIGFSVAQKSVTKYQATLEKLSKMSRLPAIALWEGHPALPSQPMTATFKLLSQLTRSMAASGQDLWTPALTDNLKSGLVVKLAEILETTIEDMQVAPPMTSSETNANGVTNGDVDEEKTDGEEIRIITDTEVDKASSAHEDNSVTEQPGDREENGHAEAAAEPTASASTETSHPETDVRKVKSLQLLFDIYYVERILSTNTDTASKALKKAAASALEHAELPNDQHEKVKKNASDYWRKTYLLFGLLA